jgi:hypothetical protein
MFVWGLPLGRCAKRSSTRRSGKQPTKDEARRIAANIAKLPELFC